LLSFYALSFLFFFSSRRRHTRFSRDWSSDVCSSDLEAPAYATRRPQSSPALSVSSVPPVPTVRDRITFPSHIDTDWDTPAYQRRSEERRVGKERKSPL